MGTAKQVRARHKRELLEASESIRRLAASQSAFVQSPYSRGAIGKIESGIKGLGDRIQKAFEPSPFEFQPGYFAPRSLTAAPVVIPIPEPLPIILPEPEPDPELLTVLKQIHDLLVLSYNLQIGRIIEAPRPGSVYYPWPRITLTAGQSRTFIRTCSDSPVDWIISMEQSTAAVSLTVHFDGLEGIGVLAVLQAGDTARIPALSNHLILSNTGLNPVSLSLIETNYG